MTKSVRRLSYRRGDLHLSFLRGAPRPGARGSITDARHLTMDIGETLLPTSRQEFRNWLRKHHATRTEIWLIQYKKATAKQSLDYLEAVEEAICFGWIDGFVKTIDSERYATRFTPRRPNSNWTESNKERARRMIAAGKMTVAGRKNLPEDL
jgi:uncharacterized protein YdeI (YjbR/CyaY-like superfamily)